MDQLSKEFQVFAGRFSAVATDRLDRVDGGTYFSRLYQVCACVCAHDGRRRKHDLEFSLGMSC